MAHLTRQTKFALPQFTKNTVYYRIYLFYLTLSFLSNCRYDIGAVNRCGRHEKYYKIKKYNIIKIKGMSPVLYRAHL